MNSKHETSGPGGQPRAELEMSRSDSALESFLVWPLAAAALAARANVRFLGISCRRYRVSEVYRVVWRCLGRPRIRSLLSSHRCDCGIFPQGQAGSRHSFVHPTRYTVQPLRILLRVIA